MVVYAELLLVLLVIAVGVRWYLRTPMHRARKTYGVHPPEAARHDFGWGDPQLPRGHRGHRKRTKDNEERHADHTPEIGDA